MKKPVQLTQKKKKQRKKENEEKEKSLGKLEKRKGHWFKIRSPTSLKHLFKIR
ncbi:hypothetical protein GCM10023311_28710 [Flaviramulus aquimarinus]|uniref:Uncharacterized protein n=1 Tax=Flaviramulus aquimarinus TaxID=1170456 RepID=A0ABP9FF20_9FLAO